MKSNGVKITELMSMAGLTGNQVESAFRELEELRLVRRIPTATGYRVEMLDPNSGLPFDPKTGKVCRL
jgi:hypothetical protein